MVRTGIDNSHCCIVYSEHQNLQQWHLSPNALYLLLDTTYHRKKYSSYSLAVDPNQDDRASEIKLLSFARPHMRAFHCSWLGFFIAFFIWFAIAPLLGEIRETLSLTNQEVWTSNIAGVGGTIFMRFLLGPMCDKFGSRILLYVMMMIMMAQVHACGSQQS